MIIKLMKTSEGAYVVFWKRLGVLQPQWYFTDYDCTRCFPKFCFDRGNTTNTKVEAMRKALKFLKNYMRGVKLNKVAVFKSVAELEAALEQELGI